MAPGLCDTAVMTIVLIAVVLYLVAAGLLVFQLRQEGTRSLRWLLPALAAVVLHFATHAMTWRHAGGADLHFFSALSLVALWVAVAVIGWATGIGVRR